MKKISFFILLLVFSFSAAAFAQKPGPTGDTGWDAVVRELNAAARSSGPQFARQIDRRYGAEAGTADRLIKKSGFTAADACIALKLSFLSHKPLNDVVSAYKAKQGKGWGAVAKSLGIKPGSREFHALKNDSKSFLNETKQKNKKNKNINKNKSKSGKDKDTSKPDKAKEGKSK